MTVYKNHIIFSLLTILVLILMPNASLGKCDRTYSIGFEKYGKFLIVDKDNKLTGGMDHDIVDGIFKKMGCKLEWRHTPWVRLLKQVEDGKTDLVSGANPTDERAEWSRFSSTYRQARNVLFVKKGDLDRIKLKDLAELTNSKFKVAVQRGAFLGDEFAELSKNSRFKERIHEMRDEQKAMNMLKKGRVDGVLLNIYIGHTIAKDLGFQVDSHPNINLKNKNYIVLMSKKSTTKEFQERFNKALAEMHAEGTIKSLQAKYFE